jgi:hypothetical protein
MVDWTVAVPEWGTFIVGIATLGVLLRQLLSVDRRPGESREPREKSEPSEEEEIEEAVWERRRAMTLRFGFGGGGAVVAFFVFLYTWLLWMLGAFAPSFPALYAVLVPLIFEVVFLIIYRSGRRMTTESPQMEAGFRKSIIEMGLKPPDPAPRTGGPPYGAIHGRQDPKLERKE